MDAKKSFLWGAATAAHQVEGDNFHSDWWKWESEGNIHGKVLSGKATDHGTRYQEDLKLAADLGFNTYRFSIEWAKVEPQKGRFDDAAFAWYDKLLDECEKNKLIPMMTLHHFTHPQWVAAEGGFTNDKCVDYFGRFVDEVIRRLGPRVPMWCTFNEPMVLAVGAYLAGFMPPAVVKPAAVRKASKNMVKAHIAAYHAIHSKVKNRSGPWKERPLEVGIAHNMIDLMPDREGNFFETLLAAFISRFYNHAWLNAVTGRKERFLIPSKGPKEANRSRPKNATADFIGVNYYTKAYVQFLPKEGEAFERGLPFGVKFAKGDESRSDLGWAFHPSGFRKILLKAAAYGLPLYITENGCADKDDLFRQKYVVAHLNEVAKLIEEGEDIRGYYHWSLLDNFEWREGFGPRFGLHHVDYETFERKMRKSALIMKEIIEVGKFGPPQSKVIQEIEKQAL